jgi:hypothetical protein
MVGSAILVSLVIYFGLVEVLRAVLKPFRGFAAGPGNQALRLAAFGAAAAVILLILILRHSLFGRVGQEDPAASFRRLQKATLVVLVLGEIPAILGLGLFLVGGNGADFYMLLFASLALTFINFPRRAAWEEWLKA